MNDQSNPFPSRLLINNSSINAPPPPPILLHSLSRTIDQHSSLKHRLVAARAAAAEAASQRKALDLYRTKLLAKIDEADRANVGVR